MKFKLHFGRIPLAAVFGAGLAIACGLCLHSFRFGSGLTRSSYDLLLVSRGDLPVDDAVLVYLDEKSYAALGQPLNVPLDRALYARLIDRLTQAGAKTIVFDVVFSDPNPDRAAADQQLAAAIRRSGRVVLAADNVPDGPKAKRAIPPFPALLDVAASVGSAETVPSTDLIIRSHTPRGDNALPSLVWAAAEFLKAPATGLPGSENQERWVNYYGRAGLLPWCSFSDALDPAVVSDAFFKDKPVFVGARILTRGSNDRKDEYPSPFSVWLGEKGFMSGVEIQATMFLNLLRGDWLNRFPPNVERLWLVIFGVAFGMGLVLMRPLPSAGMAVGGMLLVAVACHFLFRYGLIWFPWLIVGAQVCVALGWSVLFNSVQLYVEKRLYEKTLALYLSPKLVKKFSKSSVLLKPGAEKHELTLIFTDIAGFTSIAEGVDPDVLAGLMNQYFEGGVSQCIHKTDGTVVKYIGDAIFAFWNAPELQVDHQLRACEAALHFRKVQVKAPNGELLVTRIGVHTGVANVGNFGSVERVDYTALGENVNLASRLEGLNKYLGTQSLISGATKAGIGDALVTRAVGRFQLKGFEKPVDVYELVGWPDEAESTRPWREAFDQALKNFQSGDFVLADMGFRRTLELRPNDGPATYYLGRLEEMQHEPAPADWTGATMMKEK